jgi:hypothetical protein
MSAHSTRARVPGTDTRHRLFQQRANLRHSNHTQGIRATCRREISAIRARTAKRFAMVVPHDSSNALSASPGDAPGAHDCAL